MQSTSNVFTYTYGWRITFFQFQRMKLEIKTICSSTGYSKSKIQLKVQHSRRFVGLDIHSLAIGATFPNWTFFCFWEHFEGVAASNSSSYVSFNASCQLRPIWPFSLDYDVHQKTYSPGYYLESAKKNWYNDLTVFFASGLPVHWAWKWPCFLLNMLFFLKNTKDFF